MNKYLLAVHFVLAPQWAMANSPTCSGSNQWAASSAFVQLKNAGILSNDTTDFTKTNVIRLASEKIGTGLYRQIHKITFTEKSGHAVEVITINDASHEECSMSGVEVYVVSQRLGDLKQ
jgi:hypothetical protein